MPDRIELVLFAVFFTVKLTPGALALNAARFGLAVKQSKSGAAAASYWLMGGKPKINSKVLRIPEVEYIE